ncbi:hypothetical protein Dred_1244 [Desulforamulus reducens MI-1]|uniref:Uncharacterized protein n=1 Tax=Desulforamulus reducens (strain ATCC BAA-1160 / DSM 100696 / MI-1) TaxID=349161 RepID=A4J3X5_DESRM|nr:hypothetical protein [Desulforamulus reducens]ABO49778.1 hypothetical protein Dred_1244 [Desulforamulus reducens MI-1]
MTNKLYRINPRYRQYNEPSPFEEMDGFGETSNNHLNTFWRVNQDGHMWLAESCVRGACDRKVFKVCSEAEKWARDYAYSKAKSWGGF